MAGACVPPRVHARAGLGAGAAVELELARAERYCRWVLCARANGRGRAVRVRRTEFINTYMMVHDTPARVEDTQQNQRLYIAICGTQVLRACCVKSVRTPLLGLFFLPRRLVQARPTTGRATVALLTDLIRWMGPRPILDPGLDLGKLRVCANRRLAAVMPPNKQIIIYVGVTAICLSRCVWRSL